jgi:glyoxylase-like metal-dependent hydrolase (beta-lactamase superfamily II)
MKRYICRQCGAQYPDSAAPPERCTICTEVRQYVRWTGQDWVTLDELQKTHSLVFADEGEAIAGIGMSPAFAIDQRALLVQSAAGNVLWDCVSVLTDDAVAEIKKRGGLTAIAISHPHYYTTMLEWSDAFGGVPVYIHAADRQWVMRSGPAIVHWEGETLPLNPEMTLIRCGGHFDGGTVMHWKRGGGVVFAGDILQVTTDRRHVSFMYSYPNMIPLNRRSVERIAEAMAPYAFDRIYGAFKDLNLIGDGKRRFEISVDRYLKAIAD